ncbi:MAG: histidine phosphatase family protein [Rhodobacterales bacterium]
MFPTSLVADDWEALRQPGAIALMRHALAPGTGDPASFRLEDCTTQRNLSAQGRAQAQRIGAALRERGVAFDHIWTSGWCRARETAELMQMGSVQVMPSLHSFFARRGNRHAQSQSTIEALSAVAAGARVLLVTHQVNITALTGVFPASGEIIVAQVAPDGSLEVTGRVNIAP